MKKPWQIVSVVIAFLALVFGIWQTLLSRKSTKHELGGTLSAKVEDRQVAIGESADVVVFTQDGTVGLNDVCFVPTFTNVSQYTVRDILAEYTFSGNVNFTTSDFYTSLSQGGRTVLQRNERVLYAHKQTEQPFDALSISGSEARAEIESSVTYDGAMMPFQYTTNLLVMKVAKRSGQSMEQWKQQCRDAAKRRLDGRTADLYYCTSSYVSKETNVALTQTVAQPKPATPVQKNNEEQKTTVTKSTTKAEPVKTSGPVAAKTVVAGPTEEKCGLLIGSEYDSSTHLLKATYKPSDHQRNILVWIREKWKDGEWYSYRMDASAPGQNMWSGYVESKRNNEYAQEVEVIDVMEEDTLLRKHIVIKDRKIRNRTRRCVICNVIFADGSSSYISSRGKWYMINKYSFKKDVSDVRVYPVAKGNRKGITGDTWTWFFGLLIFFMMPGVGWYFLIKNDFVFENAISEFKREWDLDSSFWAGFHIVIAIPMLIAFIALILIVV